MTRNEAITIVKAQAIQLTMLDASGKADQALSMMAEALTIVVQEAELNSMLQFLLDKKTAKEDGDVS